MALHGYRVTGLPIFILLPSLLKPHIHPESSEIEPLSGWMQEGRVIRYPVIPTRYWKWYSSVHELQSG